MSHDLRQTRALCVMLALLGAVACDDEDVSQDEQSSEEEHAGSVHSSGHSGAHQDASDDTDSDAGTGDGHDAPAPRAEVESGTLQGAWAKDGAVQSFLGVPYAKPPVGELRFQPPQAPEPWDDVRSATEFGGRCAQLESAVLQNAASDDEDCLYLNVWAPKGAGSGSTKAVLFWIHGGGNVNGSTSEPVPFANSGVFYSGETLAAEQDVVVVSLNYRLGVFGFLAHQALKEEGSHTGNQGLWDQVFALSWVQKNIEAFGGDPEQVTIFGESAGSFDVCAHVASPQSRELFDGAISQSGGCTTYQPTLQDAYEVTRELAEKVSCDKEDDVLACLRDRSVKELLDATSEMTARFGPIVDEAFLPDQPRRLFDSGEVAEVPYILGSNTDEGTLFTTMATITSQAELEGAITASLNVPVEKVIEHYPLSDFEDEESPYLAAFARIVGDARLVCSTFDSATRFAQTGAPTYMYNFDIPANVPGLGATHGAELVYVFGTSDTLDDDQRAAAKRIRTYWANFAKNGDPNGGDLLEWPAFGDDNVRLNLGLKDKVVEDFRASQCEFWRSVYDARFEAQQ